MEGRRLKGLDTSTSFGSSSSLSPALRLTLLLFLLDDDFSQSLVQWVLLPFSTRRTLNPPGLRGLAVTGASTGFGLTMTKCVLKNGDIAVATLRTPSNLDALRAEYSSDKLFIIKLDVTKPEEISSAFKEVKDRLGRIDYVFNNAGYPVIGEVEGVREADARAMFEVNFWGAMNVAKEALEFFREVNKPQGGYLLNVSSTVGLVAKPPTGWYVASKHGAHRYIS